MIHPLIKVHEDARRALYEFGEGQIWKIGKYLEIKQDSIVGDHYHKLKDELFVLLKGKARVVLNDFECVIKAPAVIDVKRDTYHLFDIKKGSILVGLVTELHDSSDDHKR